jgi:hypothetical protein
MHTGAPFDVQEQLTYPMKFLAAIKVSKGGVVVAAKRQSTTESFSDAAADWFQLSPLNVGNINVVVHHASKCSVGWISVKVNSDTKYVLNFLLVSQIQRVLKYAG